MKRDENRKSPKLIYGHLRGPLKEIPVRGNRIVVELDKFGAALEKNTRSLSSAREAGLTEIRLNPKKDYVAAMTDWHDPVERQILAALRDQRFFSVGASR